MSRRVSLPQTRHHVYIYDEDWEFLEQTYGARTGDHPIGISEAVRTILHAKIMDMRAKAGAEFDKIRAKIKAGEAEA